MFSRKCQEMEFGLHDMVNENSVCRIKRYMGYWLATGFVVLLVGLYLLPSRNTYRAFFYVLFLLPSFILFLTNIRTLGRNYFKREIIVFSAFLFYLAFSSLWGDSLDLQRNIRRVLVILIAGYGVFYFMLVYERLFYVSSCVAIFLVAVIGAFWLVDFYGFMGNKLSLRFFSGGMDYFRLYELRHYGGFYNPLLFSHTVTFFLTLLVGLFYLGGVNNFYVKFGLVCSGLIFLMLLLAAQTRMAWVVVASVYAVAVTIKWKYKGVIVTAVILGVLGFLLFQLDHVVVNRGLSYRPEIWMGTLSQMSGAWLFGHGMGAHLDVGIAGTNHHWSDTHNIYLAILYYSGIAGLLMLFVVVLKLVIGFYRNSAMSPWVILWLTYVTLSGMTDGGGVLSRLNEHWFNLVIPILFLLAQSRARGAKVKVSI